LKTLSNKESCPLARFWWLWLIVAVAIGVVAVWLLVLQPRVKAMPAATADTSTKPLSWPGSRMAVVRGAGVEDGSAIEITLDALGQAVVRMPEVTFVAQDYGLMMLHASGLQNLEDAVLFWRTESSLSPVFREDIGSLRPLQQASLPRDSWAALTLDVGALAGWRDTVTLVGLVLKGSPAQTVTIEELQLVPATPTAVARSLLAQWGERTPWTQASINFYLGMLPGARFGFRVSIVVLFLVGALGCYLLIWLVLRRRCQFDWRIAGGLVLIGWVALDAPWQWSLWQQLAETRADFAGKSDHQKALSAPDGPVYRLIDAIRPYLGDPPARVFVATASEYLGLRAAYHLYPHNPYWARNRDEMPSAGAVRSGDFVLVLQSQQVRFDAAAGELVWGRRQRVEAKPVYADAQGQLYRVF
jgi:hypothetical protein